jgi:hypothetical protein
MILALALAASGCTGHQLRKSTVGQARTLTDLQYQQVLDNLAIFSLDPSTLPWHVSLKTGVAQVTDTGSAGAMLSIGSRVTAAPNVLGTRSVVEQWSTVPVTDDMTLELLRIAYRNAMGIRGALGPDEANLLAHKLSQQIATNADISVDADTLKSILDTFQREGQGLPPGPRRREAPGPSPQPIEEPPTEDITPRGAREVARRAESWAEIYGNYGRHITDTLDETILIPDPAGPPAFRPVNPVATGLAKEVIREVNEVQDALIGIPSGWFHCGRRKEIPRDACYVGRSGHRYVWVTPDGREGLADFTLRILKLSSIIKEAQVVAAPSGVQFSPGFFRAPF